jgi:hypothetical protein
MREPVSTSAVAMMVSDPPSSIVRVGGASTLSPVLTLVPGATNAERNLSDAEFQAFQARHPSAVYVGRCYAGMDPDPNIRTQLARGGGFVNSCE